MKLFLQIKESQPVKIVDVIANNLTIPYPGEFRPAWQPGLVVTSHDFTLVRIYTDEGITGVGGTSGHLAGIIEKQVKPYLLSANPFATEALARIYRNAGSGIWCLDMALWDIIGKAAGLPLYKLWGYHHDRIPAYASAVEVGTPESRAELAVHYQKLGFKAMKLRLHNEKIEDDLAILDACLKATRGKMAFMADANQATNLPSPEPGVRWDYQRALTMARELEARGVLWLEEPLPRYDFENLARLRQSTSIPIAGGEKNQRLHEFRWLIERRVYDIIQPDPAMSEGISQLRKVAAMAEMFQIKVVPHHGMSGIGLAAALHYCCTLPGHSWLEIIYEPTTRTLEAYQMLGGILESRIWIDEQGFVAPPTGSGLGVIINEQAVKQYEV
ncbi:MAG: mandelate racemase/muconate lactonizing enzyme family protein [Deltaproteobacteria bacterium]|nr:mandelate racemase/muconate lactonizing enzyme family protein [Deltaproteobacteria bacterium]